jgi:hypothetical protein
VSMSLYVSVAVRRLEAEDAAVGAGLRQRDGGPRAAGCGSEARPRQPHTSTARRPEERPWSAVYLYGEMSGGRRGRCDTHVHALPGRPTRRGPRAAGARAAGGGWRRALGAEAGSGRLCQREIRAARIDLLPAARVSTAQSRTHTGGESGNTALYHSLTACLPLTVFLPLIVSLRLSLSLPLCLPVVSPSSIAVNTRTRLLSSLAISNGGTSRDWHGE